MAYEVLQRHKVSDGAGRRHERLELSFATFTSRERAHMPWRFFEYWRSLGDMPLADGFVPQRVFDEQALRFTGLVDCRAGDPLGYIIAAHTRVAPPRYSSALVGAPLRQFPDRLHAVAVAQDHFQCALRGKPIYHEILHSIDGVERHYARLMLPLFDAGGRVANIAVATRRFVTPAYPQDPSRP